MEYTLKNGRVVTDEDLDLIAEACERGEWPGTPIGEVIIGRPRLSPEPTKTLSFKAPESLVSTIASAIERAGESQSSFLRRAAQERAERLLRA